ncbi:restriction endonuclease subunit S [Treponema pedis]|uniref:restriction endonuclease subunit S n=1 Tax=Treponema pedis TaxID=409322 RepID=UPI001982705B|nr:restriction endonuclease subunit S [Treponema pedis]
MVRLSEVINENDTFRFDSEYFKKNYLENEKKILRFEKNIGDLCSQNIRNIKTLNLKKDFNYLQISDVDILNGLSYSTSKVNFQEIPDRATYILMNNDVCISTVRPNRNAVALIYKPKRLVGTSGFAVLRVNKKKILPEFLYIFCKTIFFITKMLRNNTASLYPAVLNSDVLNCRIPILPIAFQQKVATLVKSAHTNLETAKQKYSEAENLLLETLQLKDFHIANKPVNIKSIKESFLKTGRLDAEFYQHKYEQYWNLIKSHSYVFIRDEYTHITEKPEWKNQLYQYIEIGDININDGSYQSHWIEYKELPANAKIQVKQGDVLISTVRPYRGAITIVRSDDKDLIVSGAFTVLRKKTHSGFNTEVLKVLLRSELYKDWLLQFNVGTSYPVIKDEDILNLPIPVISKEYQTKIAEYIQKAQILREEAKSLLENAKLKVEKEISANSFYITPPPPRKNDRGNRLLLSVGGVDIIRSRIQFTVCPFECNGENTEKFFFENRAA